MEARRAGKSFRAWVLVGEACTLEYMPVSALFFLEGASGERSVAFPGFHALGKALRQHQESDFRAEVWFLLLAVLVSPHISFIQLRLYWEMT